MRIITQCCCFFFFTTSSTSSPSSSTTGCLSFLCAILGLTTDDISFKLLIDAWSPGITKSLFVATASPILLAISLTVLFIVVQYVLGRLEEQGDHYKNGARRQQFDGEKDDDNDAVERGPYYHSLSLSNHTITSSSSSTATAMPSTTPKITYPKLEHKHIPLALLDHTTTLLATIGGPKTPGHVQVLLNQTMLPLTAFFSYLVFQRKYSVFQIISAIIIVLGSILAGIGGTEVHTNGDNDDKINDIDNAESNSDCNDEQKDDEEDLLVLGKNVSIFLFFLAQIPNATSAVWKEYILKKPSLTTVSTGNNTTLKKSYSSSSMMMTEMTACHYSEEMEGKEKTAMSDDVADVLINEQEQKQQQDQQQHQHLQHLPSFQSQEENLSMPLRIIHLATCISIIRSFIALFSFFILSLFITSVSNTNQQNNPIKECFIQFTTNANSATTLLLLNNITYIYSKLASLQVVGERNNGGAFLSVLAGCIAMPLQIVLFWSIYGTEEEGLSAVTDWGLGITLLGMVLYMVTVPEQFSGGFGRVLLLFGRDRSSGGDGKDWERLR